MADPRLEPVLRHLRSLASADAEAGDAALLERLAARRDPAAFEELVRRHGPLVWRVCRRLLHDPSHAEDAFQAALLVLWQRAGSVRRAGTLASWLHGVAYRIARRFGAGRRRETAGGQPTWDPIGPPPDPAHEAAWRELGAHIEEELHRLPEKYRLPLLLTYWRGLTNEEAARDLGWRPGTFKARLVRARELLHGRLSARGVTLPVGAVALLLGPESGSGAAPPATRLAAAASLANGATAGKMAAVALLGLALAVAGLGAAMVLPARPLSQAAPARPQPDGRAQAAKPAVDLHGDPLPAGAVARLGTLRFRGVRGALAFSPDGKWVAAAAEPAASEIVLYDTATGKAGKRFAARATMSRVDFAPDGARLACSGGANDTEVFDVASGKRLFTAKGSHAAFAKGGKLLVTADRYNADPQIRTWDAATGKPLRQWPAARVGDPLNPPAGSGLQMAVAADGSVVAVVPASAPDVAQIYDLTTGRAGRAIRLSPKGWWRHELALTSDGKALATASSCLHLSPADAAAGGDKTVRLWDTATGKLVRTWRQRADGPPVFAPDGSRLAWIGYDERVGIARLWTVTREEASPRAVGLPVNNFAPPCFSPDGKVLAVVTDGHAVEFRRVADGADARPLDAHGAPVFALAFTPDGRHVVSRARDGVFAWDALTGRLLRRSAEGGAKGEALAALLPDGRLLTAERTADPAISFFRVRDPLTGREVLRVRGRPDVGSIVIAPGGRFAGLGGERDGGFSVLDLRTGRWRYRLDPRVAHFEPKLSADGNTLAWHPGVTGPPEIHVRYHATAKTRVIKGLPERMDQARARMSPDGRWLIVPSEARLDRLDLVSGKAAGPLPGAQRTVWDIRWSPDSRIVLASGSASARNVIDREARRDVRAWDAVTGRRLPHLDLEGNPQGIAFSPDGRTLLTGDREEIRLREVATGRERGRFPGHRASWVPRLAVSADGRLLASAGDDSQVLVWDLTGRAPDGQWRTARLRPEQLTAAWDALAGSDARAAYAALWQFAADPEGGTALLSKRLGPVPVPERAQLERLLADLNSGKFAVRDRADAELRRMGEAAEPALRKVLEGQPAEELRRRLTKLLDRLEAVPSGDRLRELRAVEVLERIATPAAVRVLERLAGGAPAARLTREARTSLERRASRSASTP